MVGKEHPITRLGRLRMWADGMCQDLEIQEHFNINLIAVAARQAAYLQPMTVRQVVLNDPNATLATNRMARRE